MINKRRHLKVACLASAAVFLGACSSTPDVVSSGSGDVQLLNHPTLTATASTVETPVGPQMAGWDMPKAAVVARKAVPAVTKKIAVSSKVAYVPPKPILVAVHHAKKPAVPEIKRTVSREAVKPKRKVQRRTVASTTKLRAKPYAQPVIKVASVGGVALRRPSLPAARAPVIRPATVPRKNAQRSVYVTNAVAKNKQQARLKQAKKQRASVYRAKWEKDRRAKTQQASYQPQVARAVQRRPVKNYSQRRLTGDFAGNRNAEAFVRMMVSRHGFDSSYVAGVLSQAKATSWLRKQAYADANPTKRTKKSKGPSWSNYRRRFITSKHINTGTAFYNRYRRSLQRAERQYGVPAEYILGIMGVETIYGGNVGTDRAIDALATMGFMNARRGNYFTSELESYLLMTRSARLDPLQPKASYAGALGLPQFMPSNIKKYGVDYDGDGAVNLWTPHDAIGSVANYLKSHGWKPGEIAAIPAVKTGGTGYSRLKNGFKYKHSLAKLARNGLKPSYSGVSGMVNMVKLRTTRGNEYWVGGNNFYVITRYNHSSHYAMAVHQLAQEIRKRIKPRSSNTPRVIEASLDQNLLMQAANTLL